MGGGLEVFGCFLDSDNVVDEPSKGRYVLVYSLTMVLSRAVHWFDRPNCTSETKLA